MATGVWHNINICHIVHIDEHVFRFLSTQYNKGKTFSAATEKELKRIDYDR